MYLISNTLQPENTGTMELRFAPRRSYPVTVSERFDTWRLRKFITPRSRRHDAEV